MMNAEFLTVERCTTLADVVDVWANETPNKICLTEVDGKSYSYAQLKKEIDSLAAGLHEIGVTKGSCVLTMLENSLECVESWLAINKLGAIDVPVHTAYKSYFIRYMINTTEARFIFTNLKHLHTIVESLEGMDYVKLILIGEGTVDREVIPSNVEIYHIHDLKISNVSTPDVTLTPDDIAVVLFTSGTKSGTKGTVLTYRYMRNSALIMSNHLRLNEQDVAYVCFPLSHGNGKFANVGTLLTVGGSAVITDKFSASKWAYDIRKYHITYTSLMGPMAEFVYNQSPTEFDRDNKLRLILNIPRNPDFTPKFEERFGVNCIEVYGTTSLALVMYTPIGAHKNYASCGRLEEDLWDARLVDPTTGLDVHLGKTGELWVRPKKDGIMTQGYYNDPDSFKQAMCGEWFMTGDMMSRDANGFYYYKGRSGEFIRRRGENISALEVETIIKQVDDVIDVAVIGVPTEFIAGEEDVMVIIEGKDIDVQQLIEHSVRKLPFFAIPRYWLLDELPRLPDRSIDKQLLKDRGITRNTLDRNK